ncbi:MAG: ROK family protein, partial [Candidatus Omnitrophica bacterium]|nr:ROK family protein [Candidatus Omnitrophota bacterium]
GLKHGQNISEIIIKDILSSIDEFLWILDVVPLLNRFIIKEYASGMIKLLDVHSSYAAMVIDELVQPQSKKRFIWSSTFSAEADLQNTFLVTPKIFKAVIEELGLLKEETKNVMITQLISRIITDLPLMLDPSKIFNNEELFEYFAKSIPEQVPVEIIRSISKRSGKRDCADFCGKEISGSVNGDHLAPAAMPTNNKFFVFDTHEEILSYLEKEGNGRVIVSFDAHSDKYPQWFWKIFRKIISLDEGNWVNYAQELGYKVLWAHKDSWLKKKDGIVEEILLSGGSVLVTFCLDYFSLGAMLPGGAYHMDRDEITSQLNLIASVFLNNDINIDGVFVARSEEWLSPCADVDENYINDLIDSIGKTMLPEGNNNVQPFPDRVVSIPQELAGFKAIDLGKAVIRGRNDFEVNLTGLEEKYQAKFKEICGFVSHYITGPPLEINIIVEPATISKPTIWHDSSAKTIHMQVILLTDLVPLAYACFVAYHDFILHAYKGENEGWATRISIMTLINNQSLIDRISGFLKKSDFIEIVDGVIGNILCGKISQWIIELSRITREFGDNIEGYVDGFYLKYIIAGLGNNPEHLNEFFEAILVDYPELMAIAFLRNKEMKFAAEGESEFIFKMEESVRDNKNGLNIAAYETKGDILNKLGSVDLVFNYDDKVVYIEQVFTGRGYELEEINRALILMAMAVAKVKEMAKLEISGCVSDRRVFYQGLGFKGGRDKNLKLDLAKHKIQPIRFKPSALKTLEDTFKERAIKLVVLRDGVLVGRDGWIPLEIRRRVKALLMSGVKLVVFSSLSLEEFKKKLDLHTQEDMLCNLILVDPAGAKIYPDNFNFRPEVISRDVLRKAVEISFDKLGFRSFKQAYKDCEIAEGLIYSTLAIGKGKSCLPQWLAKRLIDVFNNDVKKHPEFSRLNIVQDTSNVYITPNSQGRALAVLLSALSIMQREIVILNEQAIFEDLSEAIFIDLAGLDHHPNTVFCIPSGAERVKLLLDILIESNKKTDLGVTVKEADNGTDVVDSPVSPQRSEFIIDALKEGEIDKALLNISKFKAKNFSFKRLQSKIRALVAYTGKSSDLIHSSVYNAVIAMSKAVSGGNKENSVVLGLAGQISGLYEIAIKRGATLEAISLGNLEKTNQIVYGADGVVVKEFDAVSSNTVFEFKFRLTLRKLYQQVIGKDSSQMSHLKALIRYPRFSQIRNLVYFGEADSGFVVEAINKFIENRPEIFSRIKLTQSGGVSAIFTLSEIKDFLCSESTLALVRQEEKRRRLTFFTSHFERNRNDYIERVINKKIEKLEGKKFDVIIAVSNAPEQQLQETKKILGGSDGFVFKTWDKKPQSLAKGEFGKLTAEKSIFRNYQSDLGLPVGYAQEINYKLNLVKRKLLAENFFRENDFDILVSVVLPTYKSATFHRLSDNKYEIILDWRCFENEDFLYLGVKHELTDIKLQTIIPDIDPALRELFTLINVNIDGMMKLRNEHPRKADELVKYLRKVANTRMGLFPRYEMVLNNPALNDPVTFIKEICRLLTKETVYFPNMRHLAEEQHMSEVLLEKLPFRFNLLKLKLREINEKFFESSRIIGDEKLEVLTSYHGKAPVVIKAFMPYAKNIQYKIDGDNIFLKIKFRDDDGQIKFAHIYLGQSDNIDLTLGRGGKIFSQTYETWQKDNPGIFQYKYDDMKKERNNAWGNLIRLPLTQMIKKINQYNLNYGSRDIEAQLKGLFKQLFDSLGVQGPLSKKTWLWVQERIGDNKGPGVYYVIRDQFINDYLSKIFPRILLGEINVTLEPIKELSIWPVTENLNMKSALLNWLSTNKVRGAPIYYREAKKISISRLLYLLSAAIPQQQSLFSQGVLFGNSKDEPVKNSCPPAVASISNQQIEQYGVSDEPLNIAFSIGGTKLGIGAVNSKGEIVATAKDIKWQERFGYIAKESRPEEILPAFLEQLDDVLKAGGIEFKRLQKIGVAFAGPVDYEQGVAGTPFAAPNLPFDHYPLKEALEKLLKDQYGLEIPVEIYNDCEAAVLGEFSVRGVLHKYSAGTAMIIGTGINATVARAGKPYYGLQGEIKELGHNLVPSSNLPVFYERSKGAYTYTGKQTLGDHPKNDAGANLKGDLEDTLSGPNLDKRFQKEGFTLVGTTEEAKQHGNPRAIALIEEAGREIGQAVAAFIFAYKDEDFVRHVVLVSGVSEKLGKGVLDEAGNDIFISAVRRGAQEELFILGISEPEARELAGGIVRSQLTYERELLAFAPIEKNQAQNNENDSHIAKGLDDSLAMVDAEEFFRSDCNLVTGVTTGKDVINLDDTARPIGDIYAFLNNLYYQTKGARALKDFVTAVSADAFVPEIDAKEFYQHLLSLDERGCLPEEIIVLEIGIGNAQNAINFIRAFRCLDEESQKGYFSRLQYRMCDFSEQMLADARSMPVFSQDLNGVVTFIHLDALSQPPFAKGEILLYRHNELYDDLPGQVIIEKRYGEIFEVYGSLRARRNCAIIDKDWAVISPEQFRKEYWPDPKKLSQLHESYVDIVEITEELCPSDLETIFSGYADIDKSVVVPVLNETLDKFSEGRIPVNMGAVINLVNYLSILNEYGYVQFYDYGFESMAEYADTYLGETVQTRRFSLNATVDVNFELLKKIAEAFGFEAEMDRQYQHLSLVSRQKILQLSKFMKNRLANCNILKRLVGSIAGFSDNEIITEAITKRLAQLFDDAISASKFWVAENEIREYLAVFELPETYIVNLINKLCAYQDIKCEQCPYMHMKISMFSAKDNPQQQFLSPKDLLINKHKIESERSPFYLLVPVAFQEQEEREFGKNKTLTNIEVKGLDSTNPESFVDNHFEISSKRLAELEQRLGRAPPELAKWRLVITTDSNLTKGNVAACDIENHIVYIHPYFFNISAEDCAKEGLTLERLQLKILYHELISHITKGLSDINDEAKKDTECFFNSKKMIKPNSVFILPRKKALAGQKLVSTEASSLVKELIEKYNVIVENQRLRLAGEASTEGDEKERLLRESLKIYKDKKRLNLPVVIGISGSASSGKTAAAEAIARELGQTVEAKVAHFDDWLLQRSDRKHDPAAGRTSENLFDKFEVDKFISSIKLFIEGQDLLKPVYDQTAAGRVKIGMNESGEIVVYSGSSLKATVVEGTDGNPQFVLERCNEIIARGSYVTIGETPIRVIKGNQQDGEVLLIIRDTAHLIGYYREGKRSLIVLDSSGQAIKPMVKPATGEIIASSRTQLIREGYLDEQGSYVAKPWDAKEYTKSKPGIFIVEGILALYDYTEVPKEHSLANLYDETVFIDADFDVRLARAIDRFKNRTRIEKGRETSNQEIDNYVDKFNARKRLEDICIYQNKDTAKFQLTSQRRWESIFVLGKSGTITALNNLETFRELGINPYLLEEQLESMESKYVLEVLSAYAGKELPYSKKVEGTAFDVFFVEGGLVIKSPIDEESFVNEIGPFYRKVLYPKGGEILIPGIILNIEDYNIVVQGRQGKQVLKNVLIQSQAEPLRERLELLLKQDRLKEAKALIYKYFELQKNMWSLGILDKDPNIMEKYGIIIKNGVEKIVSLAVDSLTCNYNFYKPAIYKRELFKEIQPYYDAQIERMMLVESEFNKYFDINPIGKRLPGVTHVEVNRKQLEYISGLVLTAKIKQAKEIFEQYYRQQAPPELIWTKFYLPAIYYNIFLSKAIEDLYEQMLGDPILLSRHTQGELKNKIKDSHLALSDGDKKHLDIFIDALYEIVKKYNFVSLEDLDQCTPDQKRNTYSLLVTEQARRQTELKYGKNKEITNIEVKGLNLTNPESFVDNHFEISSKRLAELEQRLGRAPPELAKWRLVITT